MSCHEGGSWVRGPLGPVSSCFLFVEFSPRTPRESHAANPEVQSNATSGVGSEHFQVLESQVAPFTMHHPSLFIIIRSSFIIRTYVCTYVRTYVRALFIIHHDSSFIMIHHHRSLFISMHHLRTYVRTYHYSSSFMIMHHPSSFITITYSSSFIMHHPSSSIIIHHHSFIIYHHSSSSIIHHTYVRTYVRNSS